MKDVGNIIAESIRVFVCMEEGGCLCVGVCVKRPLSHSSAIIMMLLFFSSVFNIALWYQT